MVQFFGKGIKTVLIGFFLFSAISGCKDDYNSSIPSAYVDLNFNPAIYIELNIPGGSFYFRNQGYGGVIVFRDLTDSSNPFLAYDASCPYEISTSCRVVAAEASGVVKCECCGSEYILFSGSGSVIKGPATEPLKQYRTNYTGGRIIIRN